MKHAFFYDSFCGTIGIVAENELLINILFEKDASSKFFLLQETPFIRIVYFQLCEYFTGNRKIFTIPLAATGTIFQKKVWDELLKIPYGDVRSYKEIAQAVGIPRGARAVGMANHNNPIPLIIPCHRVIGSSGGLVGYAGGLHTKLKLLELESMFRGRPELI